MCFDPAGRAIHRLIDGYDGAAVSRAASVWKPQRQSHLKQIESDAAPVAVVDV
jgi:hypothetical protein